MIVEISRATKNLRRFDAVIEAILHSSRIPGAAIAIVVGGETILAKGYGYRDLQAKLPATSQTVYPIASTTKAINATLLGTLIDEGKLAWDTPVQKYLPEFSLRDPLLSSRVTVRDLVLMRTGLPRHDWLWLENPMGRADMVARLRHLELSAGFRERFQYNNLTVSAAGHIAERITGQSWESLIQERILDPLGMRRTGFALPDSGDVTLSYHETSYRELKLSRRFATEHTSPSGGSIHSTVEDMARWTSFNLSGGAVGQRGLIKSQTLAEIHSPQIFSGAESGAPTPNAPYAMGWFVDTYNGCTRLSHGGLVHDVNSEVMFFPTNAIGVVSFSNFGFPTLARLINQCAFDLLMGFKSVQTVEEKLAEYERKIEETRERNAKVRRVENTSPSHALKDYAGCYAHPGYGKIEIDQVNGELIFRRNRLVLPLQHWHYDAWIAKDSDIFFLHVSHAFDRTSRFVFET